jgi:hypothetical protein
MAWSAAVAYLCTKAFMPHQTSNTMLAAVFTQITQIARDLAIAIHPATGQPAPLDQSDDANIFLGTA